MRLFVGLGNPGARYAQNRHNIGFMALDAIAGAHGFGPWTRKFQAEVSEGRLGGDKVLLIKPQTFMNRSGDAVAEAVRFYKLTPADMVVFHDELDLAPGRCRAKAGGGHAGHNGLRSIIGHLGPAFERVRIGIGHPGHKDAVAGYVLHDFARSDAAWIDPLMQGIADGAPALAQGDAARFQNAVALRTAPPRNKGPAAVPGGRDAARPPSPDANDRPAAKAPAPTADPPPATTLAANPFAALKRLLRD